MRLKKCIIQFVIKKNVVIVTRNKTKLLHIEHKVGKNKLI